MVSAVNPITGVYPEQIRGEDGFFRVEEALVPSVEKKSATDLHPIELDANRGGYFSRSLLQATIFPSYFHSSSIGRTILNIFAGVSIDFDQMARIKEIFKDLGAEIEKVTTVDDQQIEVMRITGESFQEAVCQLGGSFVSFSVALDPSDTKHYFSEECTHKIMAIHCPNELLRDKLTEMGWQEVRIDHAPGTYFQFSLHKGATPVSSEREVVIRHHPNVHYYSQEKEYLINHLSMGKDVVFFDSRGLSPTSLPPSEEGLYMDADAVYLKVRDGWGYRPEQIWLAARCSGTTQAICLRHRYPNDPFNMVLEDPFERWSALIGRQVWPLSAMGLSAMNAIRSNNPITLAKAEEFGFNQYVDLFDNIRKLDAIPKKLEGSRVVIISTDTDCLIGQDAAGVVAIAVARTMEVFHLKYKGKNPKVDGHFEDVFLEQPSGPDVFSAYSQLLSRNGIQYMSNFR